MKEDKQTEESITPSEFGMEVTSIIFNRTSGWPTKLEQAIQAHNKAERERVLEEVGETKKDFLARVLREFHANNLQGKGYDFYFVLAHELNQLNQLKEQ